MKISELINVGNIVMLDNIFSKKQLLQNMVAMISETSKVEESALFEVVWERENLGSTGFGRGTALPHGRIQGLKKLHGAFAKLKKAIDFGSADASPVDLVFLLTSPEDCGADHLTALAEISRILKDDKQCQRLRSASSQKEIFDILNS